MDKREESAPPTEIVEENGNPGEMSKGQAGAKQVTVSSEREVNFLARVGLNSLEEVETMLRDALEELDQFRQLIETVKEIEGVNDLVGLIEKLNGEREASMNERSGWEAMREKFRQLNSVVKLQENERFVDRWHSVNHELQLLTDQVKGMKVQAEVEEGRLLFCKNKLEQLEKQNAVLLKEQKRSAESSPRLITMEDISKGQMGMSDLRTSITQSGVNVHSGVGLRNSDRILGRTVGMLANVLPEMEKYSGNKEDWDDFETGCMIRYGGMEFPVAMSLLKDNLEGEAKDALRGVPVEEKDKGVKCVLKWLRSRLSNETPFEELELDKLLRRQTVEGKTVGKICEELEELTAKLNGSDEPSKEAARRRQLLILYEGREVEHERLLSLFREGASYSKMKATLVELEYLRTTQMRSRRYNGGHGNGVNQCASYGREGYLGARSGPSGGVEIISRDSDQ